MYKTLCSKAVQHFKTEFVQNQTEFFFLLILEKENCYLVYLHYLWI